jgi:predicted nuclease of predicted toxin-antitoxin system
MKGFLFDENVPSRLTFTPSLPVLHVSKLGPSPTDTEVWNYARQEELVIVSKDSDFYHRIMGSEPPPWIVQLRIGNMRRADFHKFLALIWPKVEAALPAHKLIIVEQHRIQTVS